MSGSINGSSIVKAAAVTATDDRARLRQAADDLRACGIPNADKVLRLGAAAMAERCIAKFGDQPRLLARVILDGGVIYDEQTRGRRESPSDMLRDLS